MPGNIEDISWGGVIGFIVVMFALAIAGLWLSAKGGVASVIGGVLLFVVGGLMIVWMGSFN
jgi:hypothetical protein